MRRQSRQAVALLALVTLAGTSAVAQQSQAAGPATSSPQASQRQQHEDGSVDMSAWPLYPPLPPIETPPAPPPDKVLVQRGARLSVVLDTPLSTQMTKTGERVTFLLADPVYLGDGLEIPRDTRITGTVTEAKKPGAFGRAGKMTVKVERIELPTGGGANIVARLQSSDPSATKIPNDSRGANLYTMATWTLQGTLLGAAIKGGKGAAVGAGAGAAAALIVMASRRGPDLYLEPGMPFEVILDQPVELRGWDVQAAQAKAQTQAHDSQASGQVETDPSVSNDPELRTNRPQLKRRPKKTP